MALAARIRMSRLWWPCGVCAPNFLFISSPRTGGVGTGAFMNESQKINDQILEQLSNRQESETSTWEGLTITIHPSVIPPNLFPACTHFAKRIVSHAEAHPNQGDLSILDIGTGSGIAALYCASQLHCRVVATDINPMAVLSCKQGISDNHLSKYIDARRGNLFDVIARSEKFDFIYWHHPWIDDQPEKNNKLNTATHDPQYIYLDEFLRNAKSHLKPKGIVLLGSSNLCNSEKIMKYAGKYGYNIETEDECISLLATQDVPIKIILYIFSPKDS